MTDIRDLVIIVFGIVGLLALLVSLVFTIVIGLAVWGLVKAARGTIEGGIGPLLSDARETARNVRGTTTFVTDSMVAPIIRVYGVYAGVRRGLGVLGRAARRGG